jgi:hypothetical protein
MTLPRFVRCWSRGYGLPAALLLFALLSGCGGGPYPVEGQVVWKKDGTPAKELAGSQVIFDLPERQTTARGIIQADGSFRLTTNNKDGALPGEYKVLILEVGRKPLPGGDGTALAPTVMDSRYQDPSTTDLKATVTSGTNKLTLPVERAPRH